MHNLRGLIVDTAKDILKQAIKDVTLVNRVSTIKDLHPTTINELQNHIHQIQNILIAEYARYTPLKDELEMR